MQIPTLKQGKVSRENVTSFGGYHAGARIAEGEFAAMKNCTGDQFPLIATRRKRGVRLPRPLQRTAGKGQPLLGGWQQIRDERL